MPAPALGTHGKNDAPALFKKLVSGLDQNDTFVINAFLADTPKTRAALTAIREAVGRGRRVATTLDFGPRYLHSTGQLQKGGSNRVAGLHLWQSKAASPNPAVAIPQMGGDFGTLAEAQAAGDFDVLCERGRRMIGIDVGSDLAGALAKLAKWIEEAIA